MNFIILASGKGNRVKILTKNFPKALIKVIDNIRIIDFINFTIPKLSKKIAVLGYKFKSTKKKFLKRKFSIVQNKKYSSTNMVESMFCAKKNIIKKDVIIIYSDIIFEKKLITRLKKVKGNVIPLNKNWYKNWKKRMSQKKILQDAEDVEIKKNKVLSIGGKIKKKYLNINIWELLNLIIKIF